MCELEWVIMITRFRDCKVFWWWRAVKHPGMGSQGWMACSRQMMMPLLLFKVVVPDRHRWPPSLISQTSCLTSPKCARQCLKRSVPSPLHADVQLHPVLMRSPTCVGPCICEVKWLPLCCIATLLRVSLGVLPLGWTSLCRYQVWSRLECCGCLSFSLVS